MTLRKSPKKQVRDGIVHINLQRELSVVKSYGLYQEELQQEAGSYVPSPILLWEELRAKEISRKQNF